MASASLLFRGSFHAPIVRVSGLLRKVAYLGMSSNYASVQLRPKHHRRVLGGGLSSEVPGLIRLQQVEVTRRDRCCHQHWRRRLRRTHVWTGCALTVCRRWPSGCNSRTVRRCSPDIGILPWISCTLSGLPSRLLVLCRTTGALWYLRHLRGLLGA